MPICVLCMCSQGSRHDDAATQSEPAPHQPSGPFVVVRSSVRCCLVVAACMRACVLALHALLASARFGLQCTTVAPAADLPVLMGAAWCAAATTGDAGGASSARAEHERARGPARCHAEHAAVGYVPFIPPLLSKPIVQRPLLTDARSVRDLACLLACSSACRFPLRPSFPMTILTFCFARRCLWLFRSAQRTAIDLPSAQPGRVVGAQRVPGDPRTATHAAQIGYLPLESSHLVFC